MVSPAYAASVEALERLLSARVVSRTLTTGLHAFGASAATVTAEEMKPILKGPVFKQLQVVMPPDRAREVVKELMATLEAADQNAVTTLPASQDVRDTGGRRPTQRTPTIGGIGSAGPVGFVEPIDLEDGIDLVDLVDTTPTSTVPDHPELDRLRQSLRPYNMYFEWPEVQRLRAQVARLEQALVEGTDPAPWIAEADASVLDVGQKLEDRLVLQARELEVLEEVYGDVRGIGSPGERRLDSLLKRIRDAQANRQLADAEIERGTALARELQKVAAAAARPLAGTVPTDEDVASRLKELDLAAERQELERIGRDWAVLLEHRPDMRDQVSVVAARVEGGEPIGEGLERLRTELAIARDERTRELRTHVVRLAGELDRHEAWSQEVRNDFEVLTRVLDEGLPPLADVVRFQDRVKLSLERAEREQERSAEEAAAHAARLASQRERVERAEADAVRYAAVATPERLARLRDAVAAVRAAIDEGTVDRDADDRLKRANDDLMSDVAASGDAIERQRAQVRTLLERLDGLPTILDPTSARELRVDLERWSHAPPQAELLASASSAVDELVASSKAKARVRLEALGNDAGRWGLSAVLEQIRDANERLEAGEDPETSRLERAFDAAREEVRKRQLDALHQTERDAHRFDGVDDEQESRLHKILTDAREALGSGSPALGLDEAEAIVERLATTIERRIADVLPRLDAAMLTFKSVAQLNSEEVGSVRRTLRHLDGQRDAFRRVSPGLRAWMERSLQAAEDDLARLEEEERATRSIAEELVRGGYVENLFGSAGIGAAPVGASVDGERSGATSTPPQSSEGRVDPVDAWIRRHAGEGGVRFVGLSDASGHHARTFGRTGTDADDDDVAGVFEHVRSTGTAFDALGAAVGIGRVRSVAIEHQDGCLVTGHERDGHALVVGHGPALIGLLVQDVRGNDWRAAVRTMVRDRPIARNRAVDGGSTESRGHDPS